MGVVNSPEINIIRISRHNNTESHGSHSSNKINHTLYNSIGDNINAVKQIVNVNSYNYIGKKSTNVRVRTYECDEPQKTAFEVAEKLSLGHVSATKIQNGMVYILKDGSAITYRSESSSADKSPVVDIKSADETIIKCHKIHFVRRSENDQ